MKTWTNAELVELSINATANGASEQAAEAGTIWKAPNSEVTPDPRPNEPVETEVSGK